MQLTSLRKRRNDTFINFRGTFYPEPTVEVPIELGKEMFFSVDHFGSTDSDQDCYPGQSMIIEIKNY